MLKIYHPRGLELVKQKDFLFLPAENDILIKPNQTIDIPTGFHLNMKQLQIIDNIDLELYIFPSFGFSGLGLVVMNHIFSSTYIGEIELRLKNTGNGNILIRHGGLFVFLKFLFSYNFNIVKIDDLKNIEKRDVNKKENDILLKDQSVQTLDEVKLKKFQRMYISRK